MKKRYQYCILSIIVILFAWYSFTHKELFYKLKDVSVYNIAIIAVAILLFFLTIAYRFKYLLMIFSLRLPFKEWFGLSICNTMFNYYLPVRAGAVIRAYYLRKKYNFDYSYFASLFAGSNIIAFFLSAAVGLLLTLVYKFFYGVIIWKLFFIFFSLLILTFLILVFFLIFLKIGKNFESQRLNKFLNNIEKGLKFFLKNKKIIVISSIFHLLSIFIGGLRLFLCFSAIGVDVSFLQMFIMYSLVAFSMVFSLAPANLGIKEGVTLFSASLFGISINKAILAALLDRGVAMVLTFLLGLIFSRILLLRAKD